MTILLILCVLAAAGWFVTSVTNRTSSDDVDTSVADYSRAMAALDPSGGTTRRRSSAPPQRARASRPRPIHAPSHRRRTPARAPGRAARR